MRLRHRWLLLPVVLAVLLGVPGCAGERETPPGSGAGPATAPQPPSACELITASDVERAVGAPVSNASGTRDRCRYVSERGDDVEITVDRPGFNGAVPAYLQLNPEAEPVEGIGDEGALRIANGVGELIFVKGAVRFFVVFSGRSSSRDPLLGLARVAAERL